METKKKKRRQRIGTKGVQQKGRDVDNQIERTRKSRIGQAIKSRQKTKKEIVFEGLYTPTIEEWGEMVQNKKPSPSYIDQILPNQPGEGILFAGRTGIGKTNLSLYMAYCLASGEAFYGFRCKKVTVAYFAYEGGERNFLERINKIKNLFPQDTGDNIKFFMIPTLSAIEMYNETMGRLEIMPECKVVILDGARHIMHGDPSKTTDAQNFCQQFKAHLTELGMSAVLTLQITKPNKNSLIHPGDIYTIKGAVEFAAWATSSLLLEKQTRKEDITLYFDKHRIATLEDLKPKKMIFNYEKCSFELSSNLEIEKTANGYRIQMDS